MASSFIKSLRSDLGKIEQELDRLTKQAEHFRSVIEYYEHHGDADDGSQPAKAVRIAIVEILDAEGAALHYTEVYRRLQERGITMNGQKPAANVLAQMSGDPRFVNVGRGVWGLKRWNVDKTGSDTSRVSESAAKTHHLGDSEQTVSPEGNIEDQRPTSLSDRFRSVGSR